MVVLVENGRRDLPTDGFHLLNSSVAAVDEESLVGFVVAFFRTRLLNGLADGVTFRRVGFRSSSEDDTKIVDDDVEYETLGTGNGGERERDVSFSSCSMSSSVIFCAKVIFPDLLAYLPANCRAIESIN